MILIVIKTGVNYNFILSLQMIDAFYHNNFHPEWITHDLITISVIIESQINDKFNHDWNFAQLCYK